MGATLRTLGLVALLALCGCYEEEVAITLQPDGSGMLKLRYAGGGGLAALGGLFEFGDETPEQRANRQAARQLASYAGVDAWTDVQVTPGQEEGKSTLEAVGWFADLAQVRKLGEGQGGERWTLTRDGDALVVSLADSVEPGGDGFSGMGPEPEEVLSDPLDDLRGQQMALPLLMQGMLGGFKANLTLALPAAAEQAEGWTRAEGAKVELVRDAAWAGRVIRRNFEQAIALRKRMDAGELTREQAEAELARLQGALDVHSVRCAASGAADPAFAAQRQAAEEAWANSPWRRLVAEAAAKAEAERAEAAAEAEEGEDESWRETDTPAPAGLSLTGKPDRCEPNDTYRRATPLGPGGYENLQLDDADWYRIDVPGAFLLEVTVLYDESKGMLGLSIHDEEGHELASQEVFSEDHTEVARFAPGKSRTLLIEVDNYGSDPQPYHLSLALLPFEPADRFEPNDSPASARPLPAGEHTGLVCNGEDHYLLEVPAGYVLEAAVLPPGDRAHEAYQLQLEVLEQDPDAVMPDTLARSANRVGGEFPRVACRGTGKPLVLKVSTGFSQSDSGGQPYGLEVMVREDPKPDAFEPNQSRGSASRLAPGKHEGLYADPEDWYNVQLPAGKQLQLDFAATDGELEVEVLGWERREALLARRGDAGRLEWGPGAAGNTALLIRITAEGLQAYTLNLAFVDYVPPDAHEPNDTRQQAAKVGLGRLTDLVLTADDYYAVELQAGQTLRVDLEFAEERGAWTEIKLLDPLGMELAEASWPDRVPLEHTVDAAGTYYVWIKPQPGEVGTPYTLTLE